MAAVWHSLAHLVQPGTALLLAWQWGCHPQQHITGTAIARLRRWPALPSPPISVSCWLCFWDLPSLHSSPDTGEGARAELSRATCPGQRPQQGEANPVLPSPKAIKNEAHSAAHLSSDQITERQAAASPSSPAGAGNATWTAQHPTPPTPTLRAAFPQKLAGKLGGRKRLHPLPYLPEERCPRKGKRQLPGESRSAALPRPDRSRMQWRGTGRLAAEGKRSYRFAKTPTKDTDWEQTKHSRDRNLGKCRDKPGPNTRHRALGRETSPAVKAPSLERLQSRGC